MTNPLQLGATWMSEVCIPSNGFWFHVEDLLIGFNLVVLFNSLSNLRIPLATTIIGDTIINCASRILKHPDARDKCDDVAQPSSQNKIV